MKTVYFTVAVLVPDCVTNPVDMMERDLSKCGLIVKHVTELGTFDIGDKVSVKLGPAQFDGEVTGANGSNVLVRENHDAFEMPYRPDQLKKI